MPARARLGSIGPFPGSETLATVLLGCELGSGHAHLRRLLALAGAFRERGHTAVLVVNDLVKAEVVIGGHGLAVLPAPSWRAPVGGLPPLRNYTDVMLRQGFVDAGGLRGLARAWRSLVQVVRPQLLVLDHSPLALFATRGLGLPRLRFGDGWGCPALDSPMPPFAWWAPRADPFDVIGERSALHVANAAAAELGLPAAAQVAEFLRADADCLCTLPELDHYGRADTSACVGPVLPDPGTAGPLMPWPKGDGPCAYVYLRPDCPQLDPLVAALRQAGWRAVLHVPGLPSARAKALADARLQLSPEPVAAAVAAARCDVAISHGGYAMAHAMALAGKPQLLLTQRLEQQMLSHRLQATGSARVADAGAGADELASLLTQLLGPPVADAARALARRHAGHDGKAVLQALVQRCEAML